MHQNAASRSRHAGSVSWIDGGAPADEEAHAVWHAIVECGLTALPEVAAHVAEALFRRDLAGGGAVAGIGMFAAFYEAHAYALLQSLNGTMICLGEAPPWAL